MFCRKCGKNTPDDSLFCTSCGESVYPPSGNICEENEQQTKPHKKSIDSQQSTAISQPTYSSTIPVYNANVLDKDMSLKPNAISRLFKEVIVSTPFIIGLVAFSFIIMLIAIDSFSKIFSVMPTEVVEYQFVALAVFIDIFILSLPILFCAAMWRLFAGAFHIGTTRAKISTIRFILVLMKIFRVLMFILYIIVAFLCLFVLGPSAIFALFVVVGVIVFQAISIAKRIEALDDAVYALDEKDPVISPSLFISISDFISSGYLLFYVFNLIMTFNSANISFSHDFFDDSFFTSILPYPSTESLIILGLLTSICLIAFGIARIIFRTKMKHLCLQKDSDL